MAETSAAARRYAEAIFELGDDAGSLQQWQQDLETLAAVAGDAGVVAVLENPKQPLEQRLALLDRALAGISPLTQNLARLLVSRGRFGLLPRIQRNFQEMLDKRNNVVNARVTSAVALTDDERRAVIDRVRALSGASDVRLETQVDPSIIGGLIIRVGDTLIDGSTRARLVQLKRRLTGVAS